MSATKYNTTADYTGILNAVLCLLHCLLPAVLSGLGIITEYPIITYFFVIFSFITIYQSTKKTRTYWISLLLWVSFLGFLVTNLFEEDFEWLHRANYFFGSLIIIGHVLNIKTCKNCN
jgi:hypothetical protein